MPSATMWSTHRCSTDGAAATARTSIRRSSGALREVERSARPSPRQGAAPLGSRAAASAALRSTSSIGMPRVALDAAARPPSTRDEPRAQALVPQPPVVERSLERRRVERRRACGHGADHVVGAADSGSSWRRNHSRCWVCDTGMLARPRHRPQRRRHGTQPTAAAADARAGAPSASSLRAGQFGAQLGCRGRPSAR